MKFLFNTYPKSVALIACITFLQCAPLDPVRAQGTSRAEEGILITVAQNDTAGRASRSSRAERRAKPCESIDDVFIDDADCDYYIKRNDLKPRTNEVRRGTAFGIDPEAEIFRHPDKQTIKVISELEGTWCQMEEGKSAPRMQFEKVSGSIMIRQRIDRVRIDNSFRRKGDIRIGAGRKVAVQATEGEFSIEGARYINELGMGNHAQINYYAFTATPGQFIATGRMVPAGRYYFVRSKSKQIPFFKCVL